MFYSISRASNIADSVIFAEVEERSERRSKENPPRVRRCRLKELGLPGDAMGSEDFGSGWLGLF